MNSNIVASMFAGQTITPNNGQTPVSTGEGCFQGVLKMALKKGEGHEKLNLSPEHTAKMVNEELPGALAGENGKGLSKQTSKKSAEQSFLNGELEFVETAPAKTNAEADVQQLVPAEVGLPMDEAVLQGMTLMAQGDSNGNQLSAEITTEDPVNVVTGVETVGKAAVAGGKSHPNASLAGAATNLSNDLPAATSPTFSGENQAATATVATEHGELSVTPVQTGLSQEKAGVTSEQTIFNQEQAEVFSGQAAANPRNIRTGQTPDDLAVESKPAEIETGQAPKNYVNAAVIGKEAGNTQPVVNSDIASKNSGDQDETVLVAMENSTVKNSGKVLESGEESPRSPESVHGVVVLSKPESSKQTAVTPSVSSVETVAEETTITPKMDGAEAKALSFQAEQVKMVDRKGELTTNSTSKNQGTDILPHLENSVLPKEAAQQPKGPVVIDQGEFGARILSKGAGNQGQKESGLSNSKHRGEHGLAPVKYQENQMAREVPNHNSAFAPMVKQAEIDTGEPGMGSTTKVSVESVPPVVAPAQLQNVSAVPEVATPVAVQHPREVVEQIIQGAHVMVREGATEMQIRLQPEELGRVELQIRLDQEGIKAHFVAESETVKALIETSLPQLKNALQQSGLQADNLSVSIGNKGAQSDSFGSGQQQQGYQESHHRWAQAETMEEPERFEAWTTKAVWQGQVNITA